MSARELVVLGTASQVPTRTRNHNGYLLRWDADTLLFDPGEGVQRQMLYAGISATDLTRIAITHLHGDHSLGLAGIAQRVSLDAVPHPIPVTYPASGQAHIEHLLDASVYAHRADLVTQPVTGPGVIDRVAGEKASASVLRAIRLDHGIDTFGYRVDEPAGWRVDPALTARAGLTGPAIGVVQREGSITMAERTITREQVCHPRPGQSFAHVMDTRLCDGVHELADGADMLVVEATYLHRDAALARDYGHLTARQAAQVAAEHAVRTLVLTHFSQRYTDSREFAREAREHYDGRLVIAEDLDRIPVPARVDQP